MPSDAAAGFTKVRSVLAVPDLAVSVEFYTTKLGMTVDFTAPGWAFLSRGAFRVMLGECAGAVPMHELGDHQYFVYVTVENIDAFDSELVGNGAALRACPTDKPWGMREFGLTTPDGHRIVFGEES